MQRFGIGLVYHQVQRKVTCCRCGAVWEERFIGVCYFNSDGRKSDAQSHVCPRCIIAPLTVDFVIEQEIALAAGASDATPAQVRKNVLARYEAFLNGERSPRTDRPERATLPARALRRRRPAAPGVRRVQA